MQNTKIDLLNIQHKCIVVIEKPKYMINNVFSWIKTAIKTGKLKGNIANATDTVAIGNDVAVSDDTFTDNITTDIKPSTIFNLKTKLAKETKIRLEPFLRKNNNKQGVLVDPLPWCLDVPYFIIGDNYNEHNYSNDKTANNYITSNNKFKDYANDRITSCSVSQEIGGNWTANITLNNTDDVYTLNNIYYYNGNKVNTNLGQYVLNQNNTCIIEPNDEVTILMSDWEGNFNCVFSGLVSNVSLQDDGLNKSVQLTCDDMLKKLTWHNYNSQPSLDILESQGNISSIYKESYMHMSIDKLLEILLGDAYCDLYKSDKFLAKLANSYYIYYTYKDDQQYNKQAIEAISAIPTLIKEEIEKYISPTYVKAEMITDEEYKQKMQQEIKNGKIKSGSRGYKATINYPELFAKHALNADKEYISTNLYEDKDDIKKYCDIAFEISGEEQPAWSWTIKNGWDFLFSHYEKNSDVIARIKGITQYEFFADATGVVKYRAPNFTLPRVNSLSKISAEDSKNYDEYITDNYWLTTDLEKYFINFNTTVNDNKIFTRVNVKGQWDALEITFPTLGDYIEAPTWYTNKYGTRFMQDQMRVGLTSKEACKSYGELLLWKNNINYEVATATCILNSNYIVGQPIYIERYLAVWYIGRVEHSFTSGGNCTTTLTLTYKRTPLCYRKDIDQFLANEQEYGKLSETEVKYIKNNLDMLTWGRLEVKQTPDAFKKEDNKSLIDIALSATLPTLEFVWQPIPADLYPLTLELQKQVALTNETKQNKRKTTKKIVQKNTKDDGRAQSVIVTYSTYAEYLTSKQKIAIDKAREEAEKDQIQQGRADKIKEVASDIKDYYDIADEVLSPIAYKVGTKLQDIKNYLIDSRKKEAKTIKKGIDYFFYDFLK